MPEYQITGEPQHGGYIDKVELEVIETIPDNAVVVDAGANRGDFIQAVIERRDDARIYAFEPQHECRAQILERFAVGRRDDRGLCYIGGGLSDGNGYMTLFMDQVGSQLGTFHPREIPEIPMREEHYVDVARLDDVLGDMMIGWVDLLKIDTEGHEINVLRGAPMHKVERIMWEVTRGPHAYRPDLTDEQFATVIGSEFEILRLSEPGSVEIWYAHRTTYRGRPLRKTDRDIALLEKYR